MAKEKPKEAEINNTDMLKIIIDIIKELIPAEYKKTKIAILLLIVCSYSFFAWKYYENTHPQSQNNFDPILDVSAKSNLEVNNYEEGHEKKQAVFSATDAKFDLNQWEYDVRMLDLSEYQKTGWICPKKLENYGFSELELWHREGILPGKVVKYKFEIRPVTGKTDSVPSVGFLYNNKENEKYRIYFPGKDSQRIEFSDPVRGGKTETKKLTRRIDVGKEVAVNVFLDANSSNLIFKIKIEYFPTIEEDDESKSIPDDIIFASNFLWTSPLNLGSEKNVGLSVFSGTCFRVSSFIIEDAKGA